MSNSIGLTLPPAAQKQGLPSISKEIFEKRFGNDPIALKVINAYYSSYLKGLVPITNEILAEIEDVIERVKVGGDLTRVWQKLLIGDTTLERFQSTHRPLPNRGILERTLKVQAAFQNEMRNLIIRDRYLSTMHEVDSELNRLKEHAWELMFDDTDTSMSDSSSDVRSSRSSQEIDDLFEGLETPPTPLSRERTPSPKSDLRDEQLKGEAQKSKRSFKEIVIETQKQRETLMAELQKRVERSSKTDLKTKEAQALLAESRTLSRAPVRNAEGLDPSICRYYACALGGDPVLEPKQAKFVVIEDKDEIGIGEATGLISRVMPPHTLFELYDPNSLYNAEKGVASMCYEDVSQVMATHTCRKEDERTRRKPSEKPGMLDLVDKRNQLVRGNFSEETGKDQVRRQLINIVKRDGWTSNRRSTAGADRHEAHVVILHLIQGMLSGQIQKLSQVELRNLGNYLIGVTENDVARLKGSYMDDPKFIEALEMFEFVSKLHVSNEENRLMLASLKEELRVNCSVTNNFIRRMADDFYKSYETWRAALANFVDEIEKPENMDLADQIGKEVLASLRGVVKILEEFIQNIPEEIKTILSKIQEVEEKHKETTSQLILQRDQIAKKYEHDPVARDAALKAVFDEQRKIDVAKSEGINELWTATQSADAERVVSLVLSRMQKGIREMTPHLIRLVPFTQDSFQERIKDGISKNEILKRVYANAIPPLYQNLPKVEILMDELLKKTGLSALWLNILETKALGKASLDQIELARSLPKI